MYEKPFRLVIRDRYAGGSDVEAVEVNVTPPSRPDSEYLCHPAGVLRSGNAILTDVSGDRPPPLGAAGPGPAEIVSVLMNVTVDRNGGPDT